MTDKNLSLGEIHYQDSITHSNVTKYKHDYPIVTAHVFTLPPKTLRIKQSSPFTSLTLEHTKPIFVLLQGCTYSKTQAVLAYNWLTIVDIITLKKIIQELEPVTKYGRINPTIEKLSKKWEYVALSKETEKDLLTIKLPNPIFININDVKIYVKFFKKVHQEMDKLA